MKNIVIILILGLSLQINAQLDHTPWDAILRAHVSDAGVVDYAGLMDKKVEIKDYLEHLAGSEPTEGLRNQNQAKAYWINLYNAATIDLILSHYPLKSIMDLDNGKTWDVKRVMVGSRKLSLNEIEHEILRKEYPDARIHFAVNCAAKSCPKVWNRAWTAENVDKQLDEMTRAFVRSSANDISSNAVKLSKIFEWYAGDFGDIITFLNRYSDTDINKGAKISYNEYDWSLNGK